MESPTGYPLAARNVKHMPPPITNASTTCNNASMTPSLSLTFAPPRTATNGRLGLSRRPPSTSTSRCSNRPAADGKFFGGPTIEACALWAAPKASFTYASIPLTKCATKSGSFFSSPALNRRFSSRSTPGANSARRRRTGSIEYFTTGAPFGRPK